MSLAKQILRGIRPPASATDTAFVRFDGATGKIAQNSQTTEDASGNVTVVGGLNVSTSSWGTIRIGSTGSIISYAPSSISVGLSANATYDGANWRYITNNAAGLFWMGDDGDYIYYTATYGTAGDIAPLKARVSFNHNSIIGIGTATFPSSMQKGLICVNSTVPTSNVTNGFSLVSNGGMAQFRDGTGNFVTLGDAVYLGEKDTNGSFRIKKDGSTLKFQYRTGGTYEDVGEMSYTA